MDVEPSSSDQTLGPLSPPFLLENLSGCWTVGFCVKCGFFYLPTFVTSSCSNLIKKQTSRDIRTYQIDIQTHPIANLTTTKQAVNNQNHHASAYVPVLCSVDRFESTHSNFSKSLSGSFDLVCDQRSANGQRYTLYNISLYHLWGLPAYISPFWSPPTRCWYHGDQRKSTLHSSYVPVLCSVDRFESTHSNFSKSLSGSFDLVCDQRSANGQRYTLYNISLYHLWGPTCLYISFLESPHPLLISWRSTKIHSAFLSDPFSISLTSLSIACILLLAMPFILPILTKHQAFAPAPAIQLLTKLNSVKVEFALRPSANAWQEKSGPRVQLLNRSNFGSTQSPSLLEIFCRAIESRDEGWDILRLIRHKVRVMHGFGMQYLSFNLKFAHICSLTALERYLPNQNPRQTAASLTTTK